MRLLAPVLVFLVLGGALSAQTSPALTELFAEGAVTHESRRLPYRLLAPDDFDANKRFPLVLFLHGMGERGSDNRQQLKFLPQWMATPERRAEMPCFLLAPQCPVDTTWNEVDWRTMRAGEVEKPHWAQGALEAALAKVLRDHPIDLDRIYVTGLSMGGFGAWEFAARHPDWFAACLPVCGGGNPGFAPRLQGLPIWAWHGAADRVVPPSASRSMVDALEKLGAPIQYRELEKVGHDSWSAAYGDDGALEWMFEQHRDAKRILPGVAMLRRSRFLRVGEKIAFLGDSITQAGAEPGGYVQLIEQALADRAKALGLQVIGAGISGNKVPDLEERLDHDVLEKGATLVFIYIGINDVWHSKAKRGTSVADYEAGLNRIIDRIHASGARVVLATPTVIGECPRGENELDGMLDDYAALSRRVAARKKVALLDLREEMTRDLLVFNPAGLAKGILTHDGVHLNARGNRYLADRASRAIALALEDRGPLLPKAQLDGAGPGWVELSLDDFVNVNGEADTWSMSDGRIVCTGVPLGGARSKKIYENFEMVLEWKHETHAGNSGVFLWCPESAFHELPKGKLPRSGIEVQVLDLGYEENWERAKGQPSGWFTSHGDIFPVGSSTMKPLTPQIEYSREDGSPYPVGNAKGSRSFPTQRRVRPAGQWNHYYIRAINGEVRLWVNGVEVNGGRECSPSRGYLALESEGAKVMFRNLRLRELP
jgi:lysophospholipase L1-like esterase/poly(3-hydroxybutyrate) depolymerase